MLRTKEERPLTGLALEIAQAAHQRPGFVEVILDAPILPFGYQGRLATVSPDTVLDGDVFIGASASAGADMVINLPPAIASGRILIVKKMDANAHNIVILPYGTDTVDEVNSAVNSTITIQNDVTRLHDPTWAAGGWIVW
jgi:hypothetical protein